VLFVSLLVLLGPRQSRLSAFRHDHDAYTLRHGLKPTNAARRAFKVHGRIWGQPPAR
jgi:hypothetical protein